MKEEMRFIITKGYVEVLYEGKTARFSGEISGNGFAANANSMEWLTQDSTEKATENEKAALIAAAQKHFRWKRCKIMFLDDNGKKIR